MKKPLLVLMLVAVSLAHVAPVAPGSEVMSRCMSFPPFCPVGTEPICLCESATSFKCWWVCASRDE